MPTSHSESNIDSARIVIFTMAIHGGLEIALCKPYAFRSFGLELIIPWLITVGVRVQYRE